MVLSVFEQRFKAEMRLLKRFIELPQIHYFQAALVMAFWGEVFMHIDIYCRISLGGGLCW